MSALKVGLTLSKHVLYTLPYTIVYRRVNWLLNIKMINMKYILSTDALLYCARSTDAYKATLFDVELILHGGWISKWMSRIMCALHRIQRHPQTMQVSPLNRYRPKIIPYSNKFVMVDMFVVMLVLLRRRRGEGEFYWVLKKMTSVLQVVLNSYSILFLPSNASGANYTAGLQPKKFRPSLRFSSKLFLFSRFCHLMSDIASDLVLFLPSNALHSNYTAWLQPKKV